MQFREPKLREHYDRAIACLAGCPQDQLPIAALLDAWYWFHLTEGEHSPRAAEALEALLREEMRPALRAWYKRHGDTMNPNAVAFRDRLSTLAGEKFG